LAHRGTAFIQARFPRIYQTCLKHGIDLGTQPAPVHPAAHYAMGGVRTGLEGRTSLPGLYAAGEVACTGAHGANRLASNSLLEGVVFGARAGVAMRSAGKSTRLEAVEVPPPLFPSMLEQPLRRLAWEVCGIIRRGGALRAACERLASGEVHPNPAARRQDYELRNMHAVAHLIARCALARRESRGAHFRSDYPEKLAAFAKHSVVTGHDEVQFK
jgi:L-aspartate oxidase